jgi:hypothetical protein
MREPVAREASGSDQIGEAARRLDRALTRLEKALAGRDPGAGGGSDLFERDRSELAAKLDAARARERALEEAAAAASDALGRAAAEVRLALGEDEPADEAADEEAAHEASPGAAPAATQGDLLGDNGETAGAELSDKASAPAGSDPHKDAS